MLGDVETSAQGVSPLARLISVAEEEQLGLHEVRRVCSLRLRRDLTQEEVDEISRVEVAPDWFAGTNPGCAKDKKGRPVPFRLWRQQAEAILRFDEFGGAFVSTRTGSGKTIIAVIIIKHAHAPKPFGKGIRRSLLVIPSRGRRKLVDYDLPKLRKIVGFDVPVHLLFGLSPKRRLVLAESRLAGCYVTTYSLLQREHAVEELEALAPELVVADEAHLLANSSQAAMRTASRKRFFRMLDQFKPMFVPLSGTMNRKSFLDSWPLAVRALREHAPVPLETGAAEVWALVIDSKADRAPSLEALRSLEPLRQWVIERIKEGALDPSIAGGPLTADSEGIRRAYKVRRHSAPGVVAAAANEVGVSLVIANRPCWIEAGLSEEDRGSRDANEGFSDAEERRFEALDKKIAFLHAQWESEVPVPTPEDWVPREFFDEKNKPGITDWEKMIGLLWAVEQRQRTPNGDEIDYFFHVYQHAFELTAGFYNELVWPEAPDLARERGISEEEAEKLLAGARNHRRKVGTFLREMRFFLAGEHVVGLDTPLGIWNACGRKDRRLPDEIYKKWLAVKAAEFPGMPVRISREKRVCDWKIRAAVRWAREIEAKHGKKAGGLVWCWNNELMRWAYEIFRAEFGEERTLFCPRGKDREIMDPASGSKFTIASIGAHGDIKDLPHFEHQVFLQVPRAANVIEQTLGRTFREGQKADELIVRMLNTLSFDRKSFSALLHDAMWVSQVEARQKIIFAEHDPMPLVFPSRFLQEHGFRMEKMGQDEALALVFGKAGGAS